MHLIGLQRGAGAPDSAARALLYEWVNSAQPLLDGTIAAWVARFRNIGFMVGDRVAEHERPKRPLRLYRAAHCGDEYGMSWTPFRLTAWSYSSMLRGGCPIWTAEIDPSALLAALPGAIGGAWDEVVVDPPTVHPVPYEMPASAALLATRRADRAQLERQR